MRRASAALALMLALTASAILFAAPEKSAAPKLTVIYYYLPG
jgi:hypothetical protein